MVLTRFLLSLLIIQLSTLELFVSAQTCGCDGECTAEVLNTLAGDYTCGARINNRMDYYGDNELEACRRVAGDEFPNICGPACDPDRCNSTPAPITPAPTYPPQPTPSSLYCFPPDDGSRLTFENMWSTNNGSFKVQVKERNDVCGPRGNQFTRNTVSRNTDANGNDELILQLKKNGSVWEASEVRVVRSNGDPFLYGNFTFHVQSVAIKNTSTGATVSNTLPINLVLGFFTWDPTDRLGHYDHEVDVEISQWEDTTDADTQFVVQPSGSREKYRFYSGATGSTYDQSDQWHSFRWLPNTISWLSTAGGGQSYVYTTEQAVTGGGTDYIQCLPADIEIRINLWSLNGPNIAPTGVSDNEYVEVVIRKFGYEEAGVQHVETNGYCSKHCQCAGVQGCVNGRCMTSSQTDSPTISPTKSTSTCNDSPFKFRTTHPRTGRRFWKNCAWVRKKSTKFRCTWPGAASACPKTCTNCSSCIDTNARIRFYKSLLSTKPIGRSCKWTANGAKLRCLIDGMADTCRSTCGQC